MYGFCKLYNKAKAKKELKRLVSKINWQKNLELEQNQLYTEKNKKKRN